VRRFDADRVDHGAGHDVGGRIEPASGQRRAHAEQREADEIMAQIRR